MHGVLIEKKLEDNINIICSYIKEQENNGRRVIILSHKANLYNICLNRNTGDFDLYFLGNLGKDGENNLIIKLQEMKHTILLTERNEEEFVGQEATKARDFIALTWKKIGTIEEYIVYKSED